MSKEQIKEMARITAKAIEKKVCTKCEDCKWRSLEKEDVDCTDLVCAEALYNAGYRKQSEGEWISNRQTDEFICSLCGAIAPVDCLKEAFYESKFCPNCGARMKGGEQQ